MVTETKLRRFVPCELSGTKIKSSFVLRSQNFIINLRYCYSAEKSNDRGRKNLSN